MSGKQSFTNKHNKTSSEADIKPRNRGKERSRPREARVMKRTSALRVEKRAVTTGPVSLHEAETQAERHHRNYKAAAKLPWELINVTTKYKTSLNVLVEAWQTKGFTFEPSFVKQMPSPADVRKHVEQQTDQRVKASAEEKTRTTSESSEGSDGSVKATDHSRKRQRRIIDDSSDDDDDTQPSLKKQKKTGESHEGCHRNTASNNDKARSSEPTSASSNKLKALDDAEVQKKPQKRSKTDSTPGCKIIGDGNASDMKAAGNSANKGVREHPAKKPEPRKEKPDSPAKNAKPSGVSKRAKKAQPTSPLPKCLKGLKSNRNACFIHSFVQAMAAALSAGGQQSAARAILGDGKDLEELDVTIGRASRRRNKAVEELRDRIAKGGDKVSANKRLSALLDSLREPDCAKTNKHLSDFQAVVAHSKEWRADFDGEEQQDVFEYYQNVIEALKEDPQGANPEALKAEFDFEVSESLTCKGCGSSRVIGKHDVNHHIINVASAGGDKSSLDDLFAHSLSDEVEGEACAKCNGKAYSKDTKYTRLPRTMAVYINRSVDGRHSKDKTPVEYSSKTVEINGLTNNLFAVIQHGGKSTARGHYAIFRKVAFTSGGHRWYLIDGEEVREVPDETVMDGGKAFSSGQSAMLFFRRGKPAQPAEEVA